MRRTRLDSTTYGEVKPVSDEVGETVRVPFVDEPSGREDRWTIRRGALSRQLVLDAQALFEQRMQRQVSENEARNMLGNLADYVWMLVQWEVSAVDPTAAIHEKNPPGKPRGRPRKSDYEKRRQSRRSPPT
ncbi:hypothetical protein Sbs19_40340 [Sphingobium sp. BS19]|nr:hypothetical protein Sbs19_40340 [Sphingobium sp. BS19]